MPESPTDTFHLAGSIIRILTAPPDDAAGMMVAECRTRPGAGSPPNRHPGDDESFYVLTGKFEFVVDGKALTRGPGGFVHIPLGHSHRYTNTADSDSTMLIICTPGLVHDSFFRAAGEALASGETSFLRTSQSVDKAALRAIATRCGIEFLERA